MKRYPKAAFERIQIKGENVTRKYLNETKEVKHYDPERYLNNTFKPY